MSTATRQHIEQTSAASGDSATTYEALPTVDLLGVTLHAIREQQAIDVVIGSLSHGRGGWVVTPNLDILRRCVHDRAFHELIAGADLVLADGMPLVWASRLQGTPLPERVAGSSLITPLTGAAASAGRRVFLLGGAPGTADGAAAVLRQRFPDLGVAGTYCPPIGFEHDEQQWEMMTKILVESRPDIVYVALGSPKQEQVAVQLRKHLPDAWWLGIGISFSFLTGDVRRAPKWMQRLGLEWVHRLWQEPGRLARRYLIDGIPFAGRLFGSSLVRRFRSSTGNRAAA